MADRLIPGLMPGSCSETICVRVSRLWDFYDPQDESNLLHCDLVLIDEEVRLLTSVYSRICLLYDRVC
jgi:replication factor A1